MNNNQENLKWSKDLMNNIREAEKRIYEANTKLHEANIKMMEEQQRTLTDEEKKEYLTEGQIIAKQKSKEAKELAEEVNHFVYPKKYMSRINEFKTKTPTDFFNEIRSIHLEMYRSNEISKKLYLGLEFEINDQEIFLDDYNSLLQNMPEAEKILQENKDDIEYAMKKISDINQNLAIMLRSQKDIVKNYISKFSKD